MDIVVSLVSDTFDDVVKRGWYATQDQFLASCLEHPAVDRVVVVDAPRGLLAWIGRAVRRRRAANLPAGLTRVRPLALRRTPDRLSDAALRRRYRLVNRELAFTLRRRGFGHPALLAFNTWHAAAGRPRWAGAMAFYAQDDEAAIAHIAARRSDVRHAYRSIAASEMPVFTVSDELARRIGMAATAVTVPNGLDPALWRRLPVVEEGTTTSPAPVVTYVGTVDDRLDVEAFVALGAAGFDVRVVGPARDRDVVAGLSAAQGVTVDGPRSRQEVVALLTTSSVVVLAHRSTPLTNAMSPLKLYEYVASGRPVVATDLPGMRDQHPSVTLVPPGGDYVAAVRAAAGRGPLPEVERLAAVESFSWRTRHRVVVDVLAAGGAGVTESAVVGVTGDTEPRVLYLVDGYPSLPQTFVSNEVLELRRRGVRVDVLALAEGGAPDVDPDHTVVRSTGVDLAAWVRLARRHPVRFAAVLREIAVLRGTGLRALAAGLGPIVALADSGIDVVHSHFAWSAAVVSRYAAIVVGAPRTVTVHARDIYVDRDRQSVAMLGAAAVMTVCEYNREFLHRVEPRVHRVEVVPCGVEVPDRVQDPVPGRIVAVGRLVPKKGLDLLVAAVALIREEFPDVDVRIVGEGPERGRLEELIARHGLAHNVTLLGSRPHPEALALIAVASVFVLPCRVLPSGDSDALPVVIREAMARGVPVVSTRTAGIPETVDGSSGWIGDPERPDQIAEALRTVLRDPAAARERGRSGRLRVEEHYTLRDNAEALRRVWGF